MTPLMMTMMRIGDWKKRQKNCPNRCLKSAEKIADNGRVAAQGLEKLPFLRPGGHHDNIQENNPGWSGEDSSPEGHVLALWFRGCGHGVLIPIARGA